MQTYLDCIFTFRNVILLLPCELLSFLSELRILKTSAQEIVFYHKNIEWKLLELFGQV